MTTFRYEVVDERGQVIAQTTTKWVAERLVEGMEAESGFTSNLGSWTIRKIASVEDLHGK